MSPIVKRLSIVAAVALLAGACSPEGAVTGPEQDPRNPLVSFDLGSGTRITYTVQAFTSRDGQLWSMPSCNFVVMYQTISHDTPGFGPHTDSIAHHSIPGSGCDAPSPYNGGWVNIYEVRAGGDVYVGQVSGNMVWKDFSYVGDPLNIKLVAWPDLIQENCSFDRFDNYPQNENGIVVPGSGALPRANFICGSSGGGILFP